MLKVFMTHTIQLRSAAFINKKTKLVVNDDFEDKFPELDSSVFKENIELTAGIYNSLRDLNIKLNKLNCVLKKINNYTISDL
jgi:hypothetical protein